ncbi:holin-like protein [Gracilibacillus ureilyticus]|uniref:Holin-like protein n=1 Tax=Gracilibacillus ureilyticus TaxID=531814 RepID=A0A1H9QD27_9BACI|nr:CidA/LrgA family protein [Gracilibacillus ureilyticus]SER58320.1 holin-like protein [Gracilibacillus ureilyticus]
MKKIIYILLQISLLFIFYHLGEYIQSVLNLTIPGSIIGMLLFFVLLLTNIIPERIISNGIDLLIKDMPLFFVPVTVGVIEFFDFFRGKGSLILLAAFLSTLLVIFTTSFIAGKLLEKEADI